jgi:lipopolysaccharide/colanic/teichoic acid biosynthesis glycosyltransferase
VAAAIRLESKGPALYKSKRVGQYYKISDLLKFRTMYVNADKDIKLMSQLQPLWQCCQYRKTYGGRLSVLQKARPHLLPILYSDHEVNPAQNFYFLKKEKERAFFKIKNDPRVTRIRQNTAQDEY